MKKLIKVFLTFLILLSLNGCKNEKSGEKESNFTKSNTKNGKVEIVKEKKKEDSVLKKMGIEAKDGKIIIDTNKTQQFIESLAKRMEQEAKNITSKVKESATGIKAQKDKIIIDLNKTQKFLEGIAKEFEKAASSLQKELNKK